MDSVDIATPSWERPVSEGPSWSSHSVLDFSGCSSFMSELDEELSTQMSQTYSSLLTELHKEIDRTQLFSGEGELQRILSTSMKPLLEKVFNEASQALHLSELLRPAVMWADGTAENRDQLDRTFQLHVPSLRALLLKLGFSQNMNEVESYLISSDRICLLSKLDGLKTELMDFHQRHQSTIRTLLHSLCLAEQEKNQVRSELEKSFQPSKDQQLDSSGHTVNFQSRRKKLKSQEDSAQVLKKTLQSVEDRAQLLLQNVHASEELSRSLEQRLSGTEARVHTFQNALMACEQCSKEQDMEVLKQHEEAEKVKCKQKIKKMMKVFKRCKEKLQNSVDELQGKLVLGREALERAKAEHSAEAKQLQHALEKVREQAEDKERELHAEIIALKNKLLQKSLNMNKELEKSVKYEKELQETVMDLRQAVKTQKEGRDMALECLRKRQQNVAEVQNHLEAEIRQCSQTTVKESEEQGADSYKKISVKQESDFVPLRICPTLKEKPAGTESLKVSPFALYSAIKQPLHPSQSRVLPAFFPLAYQLCETVAVPRQESAHYYYDYSTSKMNTEPLLSVQRRLRNLQSVHFQETIKELLRSS
ncbi:hypothetical protein AOLI_G00215170 [Acnodon oligacanthus]